MSRKITVVVGKNFGDEGKGLATDFFSGRSSDTLVIKHNGGAQAGHSVDRPDRRFVFHQLSSGSFNDAKTYHSATYLPDLLKLREEAEDFSKVAGKIPPIFIDEKCRLTTVFDVVINAFAESVRAGDGSHHGSCGMGINETIIRNENPKYALSLAEFESFSTREAGLFLQKIRTEYVPIRLSQLSMKIRDGNDWCDLLQDQNIAWNAAEAMKAAAGYYSTIRDAKSIIQSADNLVFEGAQGLLLDRNNLNYWPHLTPSDTGCKNPFELLRTCGIPQERSNTEVCYVTRSYVTRHGAGHLPHECERSEISNDIYDKTNVENQWQESLRFARHPEASEFVRAVAADLVSNIYPVGELQKSFSEEPEASHSENSKICDRAVISLMVTHLNETDGKIVNVDGNHDVETYLSEGGQSTFFDQIYTSFTPFARDNISTEKV